MLATAKDFNHTYLITFKDYDDTVLSSERVVEGKMPLAPSVPTRQGYQFTGWNPNVGIVTQDQIYTAQYQEIEGFYGVKLSNSDVPQLNSLCPSHIYIRSISFNNKTYRVNKNGDTSYVYTISSKGQNLTREYGYAVAKMPNNDISSSTFAFVLQSDLRSGQFPFNESDFKDAFSYSQGDEMSEMTNGIRAYITTLSYT